MCALAVSHGIDEAAQYAVSSDKFANLPAY